MTTPLSIFSLIIQQTADEILATALQVAKLAGLPVDTWRVGDPTRTLFRAQAEQIETLDAVQVEYAKSGFLETAEADWLTLRAADVYGVTRAQADFATPSCTLQNAGGGFFEVDPGGLVVSSTATGATFTNQAPVVVNPLQADIVVSLVAQQSGSFGSVAEDEIDVIVSPTLTGVTISASSAALGSDEQSDAGLREQCLATLGALSPAGPADAYEYVARNAVLTGIQGVTRALADGDHTDGTVQVYVAADSAALDGPSVAAIQAAIDEWATPLCILATVVAAAPQAISFSLDLTPAQPTAQARIEAALDAFCVGVELGGTIARSAVAAAVHRELGATLVSVVVELDGFDADVTLSAAAFPVRGAAVLS